MRVRCLALEHNAVPWTGLVPGPLDPESKALTIKPPCLPQSIKEELHFMSFMVHLRFRDVQKSQCSLHYDSSARSHELYVQNVATIFV